MNRIINTMLVTLTIVILFNQICISDSIMPTGFENIYIGMTKSEFKTARPTAIEDTFMTFGGDLPNAIFREQLEQGSYFEMVKYYIEENILIDIQFLKDGCFHINHDGQPGDCSGFAETRCAFLRSCIDKYGNNYDVNVWHSEAMNIYDGHLRWNDQNIIIYAHYSPSKQPPGGKPFVYSVTLIILSSNNDFPNKHFISGANPTTYPEIFGIIPSQGECTPAPIFNTATPTPTVTPTPR